MSNGARLTAVIVVVAVAAIGLYLALTSPSQPAPATAATAAAESLTQPSPAEGLGELAGSSSASAPGVPPADAFGTPSGAVAPGAPSTVEASSSTLVGGASAAGAAGASIGGTSVAPGGARPTGTAATVPVTPEPATWTAPVGEAAVREYTIKSGDTLEAIARAELGSGQKWNSIVAANPGLDPKALKIGQKIKLPAAGASGAASAAAPTETMKSSGGNTYTVQRGDTLFGIARKVYGSTSDADIRRIVEANGSQLKSKDTPLKPGMKLAVPAKR
jgi:nucleoid-associated protein YgaU